jgi:hypothetical protein
VLRLLTTLLHLSCRCCKRQRAMLPTVVRLPPKFLYEPTSWIRFWGFLSRHGIFSTFQYYFCYRRSIILPEIIATTSPAASPVKSVLLDSIIYFWLRRCRFCNNSNFFATISLTRFLVISPVRCVFFYHFIGTLAVETPMDRSSICRHRMIGR